MTDFERRLTEYVDEQSRVRPQRTVPRRNWGEMWHAFNYAHHADKSSRPGIRDYWLRQVASIANNRKQQRETTEA